MKVQIILPTPKLGPVENGKNEQIGGKVASENKCLVFITINPKEL